MDRRVKLGDDELREVAPGAPHKHWSREWKIDLIAAGNPEKDLYDEIVK